jgi:hypothetical protein
VVDDLAGIDQAAVHPTGQGGLGQARTDVGSNGGHGHGAGEFAAAAIGQGDTRHGTCSDTVVAPTKGHMRTATRCIQNTIAPGGGDW